MDGQTRRPSHRNGDDDAASAGGSIVVFPTLLLLVSPFSLMPLSLLAGSSTDSADNGDKDDEVSSLAEMTEFEQDHSSVDGGCRCRSESKFECGAMIKATKNLRCYNTRPLKLSIME